VKASGLRWASLMLLTHIPWAQRVWALPVMTALAPSERYYQERGRNPKTLLERSVQMLKALRRWLPGRELVVVGDSDYAAFDFLTDTRSLAISCIARLRLDAALYAPAPPYSRRGRPRKKGERLPKLATLLTDPATGWQSMDIAWYDGQVRTMQVASATAIWYHGGKTPLPIRWLLIRDPKQAFEPLALLSTDPHMAPLFILTHFVHRWSVEVTFALVRRHLGVETQRQWSDNAIARTTPLLLGLFSWITLVADRLLAATPTLATRSATWYPKPLPTFADALAWVRVALWTAYPTFWTSNHALDIVYIPKSLFDTLISSLSYAA
jgi:hypothetical protein